MTYKYREENGKLIELTAEEIIALETRDTEWNSKSGERKLSEIRQIRNQKLSETDWLVISEKITDAQKTWRENLRKIPQDYTTENQYDTLLERKDDGSLKHSIWEKP